MEGVAQLASSKWQVADALSVSVITAFSHGRLYTHLRVTAVTDYGTGVGGVVRVLICVGPGNTVL